MRFSSKLTMAVAAIFFAGSLSAGTNLNVLKGKIVKVCSKWEETDWCGTGIPCATAQDCSEVLQHYSLKNGKVDSQARESAKDCLRNNVGCP